MTFSLKFKIIIGNKQVYKLIEENLKNDFELLNTH